MHKLLLIVLIACSAGPGFGQPVYPYKDIKLENARDYIATEAMALSAANYLLTTPFVEVDAGRSEAFQFLTKWMGGAKQYHFYMEGIATKVSEDQHLLSLYIASMAKYILENKNPPPVALDVELGASKILLAYCDNPKNNFKLKKKYRKILEKN